MLAATMALTLAACGGSDVSWEPVAALPERFVPAGMAFADDGAVVIAGEIDEAGATRAVTFRWDGDALRQTLDAPGYALAVSIDSGAAWLVTGTRRAEGLGSDYRALRSLDGGASWEDRGPVPARSVTRVQSLGPEEVAVLGTRALARSADAGSTWTALDATGARDGVRERLGHVGGRLLVIGDGVRASADGGATWIEQGVAGARVFAVDGGAVVAQHAGAIKFGRMEPGGPRWRAALPDTLLPFALRVEGERVRVLAQPGGDDTGKGLRLYESADGGATWTAWRLPALPRAEAAALGPAGRGALVDTFGRLQIAGPATP
jgi:hypothetical protein